MSSVITKKYEIKNRSIRDLYEDFRDGILFSNRVLNEDGESDDEGYQRAAAWPESMRINFILSILSGQPIPSIITWENKKMLTEIRGIKTVTREIIDGQQRMETISWFCREKDFGEIPNVSTNSEFKDFFMSNQKLMLGSLKDEYMDLFWHTEIPEIILKGIEKDEAVDIFVNINRNSKRLTPHEVREADNFKLNNNNLFIEWQRKNPVIIWSLKITNSEEQARTSAMVRELLFRLWISLTLESDGPRVKVSKENKSTLDTLYGEELDKREFLEKTKEIDKFLKFMAKTFRRDKDPKAENVLNNIPKMYLVPLMSLYFNKYRSDEDRMLQDLIYVQKFLEEKNTKNQFTHTEQREKMTMRSSINTSDKNKYVEVFEEIIKDRK